MAEQNGDSVEVQMDRLAQFIMDEVPGEPSRDEGAVDCAIRLLRLAYGRLAPEDCDHLVLYVRKNRSVECASCGQPRLVVAQENNGENHA